MSNLVPVTFESVADALLVRGVVARRALDKAVAARARDGGSLALNLVLLGAADELRLAEFYAEFFGLERLDEGWLAAPDADAFETVPFEVAYESAVMPIGYGPDGRIVAAVIDPGESAGVEEAEFYAGREFEVRVCAVTEFAEAFERAAGRPWRVPAEELRTLRRQIGASQDKLDADLEELFRTPTSADLPIDLVTPSSSHRAAGTPSLRVEIVESGDEPVVELARSGAVVRVEPVAETDEPVIELSPSNRISSGYAVTDDSGDGAIELDVDDVIDIVPITPGADVRSAPSVEVEIVRTPLPDDGPIVELGAPVRRAERVIVREDDPLDDASTGETTRFRAAAPSRADGRDAPPVDAAGTTLTGGAPERATEEAPPHRSTTGSQRDTVDLPSPGPTSPISLVDDGWDDVLPALDRVSQKTPATSVSAVLASEAGRSGMTLASTGSFAALDVQPSGANPAVSAQSGGHSRISEELASASRFTKGTPRPVPTVGEYLGAEHDGRFLEPGELVAELGEASDATRATFRLLESALAAVSDRDAIARQLVETLGLAYPTVLLLSLRSPRVVVWDGVLATGAECPLGLDFPLADGSVWHRVASKGVAFHGSIPKSDPLRRRLPRAFGSSALIAPLTLSRRVVALLVLDSGSSSDVAAPGAEIHRLVERVERALRRVIMERKNAGRSV